MGFLPYFRYRGRRGGGGASPKGLVHNLLMQVFTPGSSKIEVSEPYFLIL